MYVTAFSVYCFLLSVGFVLAVPYDRSITPTLGKREIGGKNNSDDEVVQSSTVPSPQPTLESRTEDLLDPAAQHLRVYQDAIEDDNDEEDDRFTREMEERIEAWNNIPPLPPDLLDAVDYQTRIEVLAYVRELSKNGRADFQNVFGNMRMLRPFLSRARTQLIVENTINQVEMAKRRGPTVDVLLEEKLRTLEVDVLEEQMKAMVRFRREHEGEPDSSADLRRLPLPPPLYTLTTGQDRMLAIAKARAGLVDLEQLNEYILRQDPYMNEYEAAIVIGQAIRGFSTDSANIEAIVAKPSAFQRVGSWFKKTFRRGGDKV